MTSRFGKTYSRKASDGDSGKFDEVVSTRGRCGATLSTKWGQTTYKARVGGAGAGAKRHGAAVLLEVRKRPRPSDHDDAHEDPFGFDSDEESKPVTSSRGGGATKSPVKPPAPGGGPSGDDSAHFFNHSSNAAGDTSQQSSYSWYRNASDSDRKPRPSQTTALKTDSTSSSSWDAIVSPAPNKTDSTSSSYAYSWDTVVSERSSTLKGSGSSLKASGSSLKASDSSLKASGSSLKASDSSLKASGSSLKASGSSLKASGSTLKASSSALKPSDSALKASDSASSSSAWDTIVGLRGSAPSPPRSSAPWSHSSSVSSSIRVERPFPPPPPPPTTSSEAELQRLHPPTEGDGLTTSRTYRRPPKKTPHHGAGGAVSDDLTTSDWLATTAADPRRRDVTVVSVSNTGTGLPPPSSQIGGASSSTPLPLAEESFPDWLRKDSMPLPLAEDPSPDWLRKDMDPVHSKPRCDQKEEVSNTQASGVVGEQQHTQTSGNCKMKYFGFDDMSDGDDDHDDDDDDEGGATVRAESPVAMEMMESPADSPPDPFDRLTDREDARRDRLTDRTARSYSKTAAVGFLEDDLTIMAGGPTFRRREDDSTSKRREDTTTRRREDVTTRRREDVPTRRREELTVRRREDLSNRRRAVKIKPPVDENPQDEQRRIFSALKKSPHKAVYNARHWTVDSEEEPPPAFIHLHPAAVVTTSSSSTTATAATTTGSGWSQTGSGRSQEGVSRCQDDGGHVFKAPPPPPKVIKSVTVPTELYQDPVTTLRCRKEHKELYTVVQHVKHFNDVVEFGENQEFTDDFEYLATGLKTGQPLNTRCLSVISLATRCAMGSFRMHLRARGKVAMVFKTLNDAPQHPNLALCTASLMYILSRDRLNMDLDRSCLDLMIRLLELELDQNQEGGGASQLGGGASQLSAREMTKVKEKIRKLCDTVHNKHLDLQNITAGHLAMETLLSLTSKRAGDWFKEELRLLGGLDHIVDKVKECVDSAVHEADEDKLVSSLWGAERCLRVLESVSHQNSENQSYLIAYKDSSLIISSALALRRCECLILTFGQQRADQSGCYSNVAKATRDCMRAVIGALLNLTHDNEWGSTKTGEQEGLISTALNCVLKVPHYLPQEQRFDIRVLGLGLLINLVEYSSRNKHCVMDMMIDRPSCDITILPDDGSISPPSAGPVCAITALVQLFVQRERAAVLAEAQTDDVIMEPQTAPPLDQSGEWQETSGEIQWVANDHVTQEKPEEKEDGELDLNKALVHAGKHMEDSMVASYTALLLGSLCQGSPMNVCTVRESLPQGDFSVLTEMLKKFLNFMNLTCDIGTKGQTSISRVIDYLEHC